MKALNAIGRFIASPLGAVLVCVAGSFAIWFGLEPHHGGAPKANPPRRPGVGSRTTTERGSGAGARKGDVASRSGPARPSPKARGGIAASRATADQSQTSGWREVDHEEIESPDESPVPSREAVAADRPDRWPEATGGEPTSTSTSGMIGPRDPRAPALREYATKKTGVADEAVAQKRLALWCDEHGLWNEAKSHWQAVLRLDPKSEVARKRLGYRLRGGRPVFDETSAEAVAQGKADSYWKKVLDKCHARMHSKGKDAARIREDAVAQIDAVGDPRAAAAIWKVFGADSSHHGLMVGILSRFQTRDASQILAALAVYSRDDKARAAAVAALRGRGPAEYGGRLVSLMHAPLRYTVRQLPIPGRAAGRVLFVEDETANYQFLFSRLEAPTAGSLVGCFQPRLSASEAEMVRRYNENEAAIARGALDQQVELAKGYLEKCNESIRALNERVARVLNEAGGAGIQPEPEAGRRWLALALGTPYQPPADRPKPTITQIMAPMYSPTFLPVPVAT